MKPFGPERHGPIFVMVALAVVLRAVVLPLGGYQNDVTIFVGWAHVLARVGTHALYGTSDAPGAPSINYPPGYAAILAVVTYANEALGHRADAFLKLMLKTPAALADIAAGTAVYAYLRARFSEPAALVAAAIALFAPWTWPVSALWGQVDSICTLAMLGSLLLAFRGHFTSSWIALAAGILIKPFPVLIAPLIAVAQLRREGFSWRVLLGPSAGFALAYLVSLPFAPDASPSDVLRWLAAQYSSGQSLFPITSMDAYNIWTVAATPSNDLVRVAGATLQTWGYILYVPLLALIVAAYARRSALTNDEDEGARILTVAAFVALAGLFVLATRMHERYLIYALSLAPLMWSSGRVERGTALLFTITFSLNVALDQFYKHARVHEVAFLTHGISLANALALAVLTVHFCRPAFAHRTAFASAT